MQEKKKTLFSLMKTIGIASILLTSTGIGIVSFAISNKPVENNATEVLACSNEGQEETLNIASIADSRKVLKEGIEVKQEEIPFNTEYQNGATENSTDVKTVRNGTNGTKEIKYKVIYENDVEVSREEISSEVTKEPKNKIVRKVDVVVASRSSSANDAPQNTSGKEPVVKVMNVSAYCSCKSCCGKTNGITSSGNKAQPWYTIAAGKGYPIGTRIYIPYFKDKPNGGWFVVQDRGGAISNSKIDVYMGSHSQALSFGRRNLECYIYYN